MEKKILTVELPKRDEPSHHDLNEIFGGFQSSESVEDLIEEIYKLRSVGEERELLNEQSDTIST